MGDIDDENNDNCDDDDDDWINVDTQQNQQDRKSYVFIFLSIIYKHLQYLAQK